MRVSANYKILGAAICGAFVGIILDDIGFSYERLLGVSSEVVLVLLITFSFLLAGFAIYKVNKRQKKHEVD